MFLYSRVGSFESSIPKEVRIKSIRRIKPLSYINNRILHNNPKHLKLILSEFLPVKEKFDYVFLYDSFYLKLVPYTIKKIKYGKKVFWLHGEAKYVKNSGMVEHLKEFDKIFAVSSVVAKQLVDVRPELKDKTEVFYNFMDEKGIKEKSQKGASFEDNFDGQRILTVGRVTPEKGQDLAVLACKKLIDAGYNIRWYACGAGNNFENIKQLIIDNNLENDFILMGAKENPYPYMKDCDLYVQPSYTEGCCISTSEALILGKPVILTDVGGARDIFTDGKNGYIVDKSVDAIYEKVKWCLDNPDKVQKLCEDIKNADFKQEDINRLFF